MADRKPPASGEERAPRTGWLSRFAPGVRNPFGKRDAPDNLWVKDPETGEMIYKADLDAAHGVTPSGHHMRIGATARFRATFDGGRFETVATPPAQDDPLKFPDEKPYPQRLAAARKATGHAEAIAIAVGKVGGQDAVVLVQDFAFMGGSLGQAAGDAFIAAAREAIKRGRPLVAFTASGGARMQEGTLSLMQMARATLAVRELKQAGLPYVVVLTDPTSGGVLASYAMLGDIHLAEPRSTLAFSGRRVIEQTIRETLPPGFQTAEFLQERGMVDQVVERRDLPRVLGSMLGMLMEGRARAAA